MIDLSQLELIYKGFIGNLNQELPDGIIQVDLEVLHSLDVLSVRERKNTDLPTLAKQFYLLESSEKISLFNSQYLIWIIPGKKNEQSYTLTLIARYSEEDPRLELAFETRGVYNSSKIVLATIHGYLAEMQENERFLREIEEA